MGLFSKKQPEIGDPIFTDMRGGVRGLGFRKVRLKTEDQLSIITCD